MKPLFIIAAFIVALASCKKEESKKQSSTVSTTDLTTGVWHMTAQVRARTENGQTTTRDDFATADACEKDNTMKFETDGNITQDRGALKCYPGEPQTMQKDTWEIAENGTKLLYKQAVQNGYVNTYDLVELNSTTLHYRDYDADAGFTVVTDYYYAH